MKSCLIVDDSRVVRKVMRNICEAIGFTCTEAENGQLALEACRLSMPELVMCDWNMPVMEGVEFLRLLRQDPGGDAPIVIMCTTNNDMSRIEEALIAGANEYIMKPFDEDIVRSKLSLLGLLPESAEANDNV